MGTTVHFLKSENMLKIIRNSIFALILLWSFWGCKNNYLDTASSCQDIFDVEINYRYQLADENNVNFLTDSVFLLFESSFDNDRIEIIVDNDTLIIDSISTCEVTGLSNYYNLGLKQEVNYAIFRINRGPRVFLDFSLDNRNINSVGIRKRKNKIEVYYYRVMPRFY